MRSFSGVQLNGFYRCVSPLTQKHCCILQSDHQLRQRLQSSSWEAFLRVLKSGYLERVGCVVVRELERHTLGKMIVGDSGRLCVARAAFMSCG